MDSCEFMVVSSEKIFIRSITCDQFIKNTFGQRFEICPEQAVKNRKATIPCFLKFFCWNSNVSIYELPHEVWVLIITFLGKYGLKFSASMRFQFACFPLINFFFVSS